MGLYLLIMVDGNELYRSDAIFSYSEPVSISVDISSGQSLELITEEGSSGDKMCDWALWGNPILRK